MIFFTTQYQLKTEVQYEDYLLQKFNVLREQNKKLGNFYSELQNYAKPSLFLN